MVKVKKFLTLSLAVIMTATLLAACGGGKNEPAGQNSGSNTSAGTSNTSGTSDTSGGSSGSSSGSEGFDWKKYSGTKITALMVQHAFTDVLMPRVSEFEELTGIDVELQSLSETEYWNKLSIDLSSGSSSFDVFMDGPSIAWSHIASGWMEPLDPYIADPDKTSPDYDFDDFYPAFIDANRWNGVPGGGMGEGNLYTMPVMAETTILSYRKDLFEKYNVKVPETFEEWAEAAAKLTLTDEGQQIYGVIQRGAKDISSINAGFHSGYYTYGAIDMDENLNSQINSPRAVEFTTLWVDTLKKYGPPDWTNVTWYDVMQRFASGSYAMVIDNDFMAATYEDPNKSSVAGKVAYTTIPKGPDGNIASNIWTWGLAMNSSSKNKDAAWLFIQWATGKEFLLESALAGNLDPVRKSVWENQQFIDMTSSWGDGTWREAVEANLSRYAKWQPTPHTELTATWDRWITALHEIYAGQGTPQEILDRAAKDTDNILAKAGLK